MLFLLIVFVSSVVSAVQYACPNQTQVQSNSEEINEGELKSIFALPISICGATENSFSHWIESTVFLDANMVFLDAPNSTRGTELISVNKSVSYTTTSSAAQVRLKIGGSTEDLEIGDCSEIDEIAVMVNRIEGASVDVMVAAKKTTLNTNSKPSEIIEVNSQKYGVEIISGSHIQSAIKLSKCNNGDIYESSTTPVIQANSSSQNQTSNQTAVNSTSNQTAQNNQTSINATQANQTTQNSTSNQTALKELNQSCTNNDECATNYCKEDVCAKKGFIRKILDWFKNLF